jgi:2-polyprenyl-3-methyl-5-hydroxy-6-metoxy-1,4-benzoquinol methylase
MKDQSDQYDRKYYENVLFRSTPNSQRNQQGLNELLAHKHGGKLFEIGCGKGEFLKLASRFFDVKGVDISKYATRNASANIISRIRFGNIEVENLVEDEYDAIAAFNVMEHLRDPKGVLSKIFHSLRPNGVLIGSVPLNYSLVGKLHTAITNVVDRTHISTYEPERWKVLFQDTGFSYIRFFGEVTMGKNRNIYVRHRYWPYVSFNLMFVCQK